MATEHVWGDNGVMRGENYQILFDVEDKHWWFVGRRAIVFALLEQALGAHPGAQASLPALASNVTPPPAEALSATTSAQTITQAGMPALPGALPARRILDIGCGTGATMDHLRRFGNVQGADLSLLPLSFSRQRGHRVTCASANELPFADDSFDLITALDVIEHLDDDLGGLREIQRILKPGAPAVFFVPAFMSLWGPNDVQSGHKRRYRLPSFRDVVHRAGFTIEKLSYANIAMFAPIWLGRRILTLLGKDEQSENRINHPLINELIAKTFASEAGWLRNHSLPFGVSLVCVVRKP